MDKIELDKIYCEDCLETMSRMPDDFCHIVVTSPPYNMGKNVNRDYRGRKVAYKTYNDNLPKQKYFDLTVEWITALLRVTRYHIFWNIQKVSNNKGIIDVIRSEFKNNLKETFIWAKTNPGSAFKDNCAGKGFEYIFCISKDTPHKYSFNYCNFDNRHGDYVNNVLIHSANSTVKKAVRGDHAFAFPLWLPEFFINNFSHEGDTVYDPFMGSGITARAAIRLNRHYIGSEVVADYVTMSNEQVERERRRPKSFFKTSEKYKPIPFFTK